MIDWIKKTPLLRWVLLLPLAILVSVVAAFLWNELISIKLRGDGLLEVFFKDVMTNGIQGFLFTYMGGILAPKHKKIVGMFLLFFMFFVMALFPLLIWYMDASLGAEPYNWYGVFAMVGAILGYKYIKGIGQENEQHD